MKEINLILKIENLKPIMKVFRGFMIFKAESIN